MERTIAYGGLKSNVGTSDGNNDQFHAIDTSVYLLDPQAISQALSLHRGEATENMNTKAMKPCLLSRTCSHGIIVKLKSFFAIPAEE